MSDPVRFLEWDSAFFGMRIARVAGSAELGEADARARAARIDCLYLLADAEDVGRIRAVERSGFRLADIRMSLERTLGDDVESPKTRTRPCAKEDVPVLKKLAGAHNGLTRFFRDPLFPPSRATALYETWIEREAARALEGDDAAVFVLDAEDGIAGYLACAVEDGTGRISLAGVAPGHRGRGVGTSLVRAALRWFRTRGLASASVVTQGANIPALRLYTSNGFYPVRTELWYHKWFRRA